MNLADAVFEAAYGTAKQLPPSDLAEIVFSGRSNVGKSSLINRLLNRNALARVSGQPGKTATVNFYRTGDVRLVDLPGYGYAKVSSSEKKRWADLVDGYLTSGRNIRLVIQLIDMRHPPTQLDLVMLRFLEQSGYRFLVALTKCDKLKKTQRAEREAFVRVELGVEEQVPVIPFSAVKGEGAEEIRRIIGSVLCK